MIKMEDLNMRDYVVLVDKSGSMGEPVGKGNSTSRWDYMRETLMSVVRKCNELDSDGISVYFFNKEFKRYDNITPDKVDDLFKHNSPMGGTRFDNVLQDVLNNLSSDKPTTVVVFTDGVPSDGVSGQTALAKTIVNHTNKMEADSELGITFIQVGNDSEATTFLKKLDDNLVDIGARFDVVDTKTCDDLETMTIEEILLAAVND